MHTHVKETEERIPKKKGGGRKKRSISADCLYLWSIHIQASRISTLMLVIHEAKTL
jgi:hypothetical protein